MKTRKFGGEITLEIKIVVQMRLILRREGKLEMK